VLRATLLRLGPVVTSGSRLAGHLDSILQASGGRSESGAIQENRCLMIPHQPVAHCPGRLQIPRAQSRDRSTWKSNRAATRLRYSILASASLLLAAAAKSRSFDRMSH
jgi:hypothetical protein